MKRILCIVVVVLLTVAVRAQEETEGPPSMQEDSLMQVLSNIPAFTIYKDNYIITGTNFSGGKITKYNSDAKIQISLRHRLYRKLLPWRTYLFLTYTQRSFWNIYRKSAPFGDTNYNPTLGIGRNFIDNGRIKGIGMLQFEHESNGRDSIFSRSWNRISLTGIYIFNRHFTFEAKAWIAMQVAKENKHLTRYAGIGYLSATYVNKDERLACSVVMLKRGGWNLSANWQLEIAYKIFRMDNQYFFMQFYNGYGENMLKYQEFQRYLRFGFVIKPNSVTIF